MCYFLAVGVLFNKKQLGNIIKNKFYRPFNLKSFIPLFLFCLCSAIISAQVQLQDLFSDHLVLHQMPPIPNLIPQ